MSHAERPFSFPLGVWYRRKENDKGDAIMEKNFTEVLIFQKQKEMFKMDTKQFTKQTLRIHHQKYLS